MDLKKELELTYSHLRRHRKNLIEGIEYNKRLYEATHSPERKANIEKITEIVRQIDETLANSDSKN